MIKTQKIDLDKKMNEAKLQMSKNREQDIKPVNHTDIKPSKFGLVASRSPHSLHWSPCSPGQEITPTSPSPWSQTQEEVKREGLHS